MDSLKQETIAAYDAAAVDYATETAHLPDSIRTTCARFASLLAGSGRVLEIGSGGGRDARALEEHGLSVRRTDVTPGFVKILRAQGFEADLLDPLTDDLDDPHNPGRRYDAVWAQACLMHVDRDDLPTVLTRLANVTGPAGPIFLSVTEGDANTREIGSTGARYHRTDWREPELRAVVNDSGWVVDEVWASQGKYSPFLNVLGHRADTP
ncbi:class I SAM-dependent methyltransferase [Lipingzhangella sp. LS1_29]|uniref:Class I SAM-dependent methyltransferase n=1 Tax=Lipingzhangella rawalii TaxID=2055835 RepID=A0ABU2HAH8_9ACTN|nr:class I SAM-dependent methyltransferase [Lipingzhangella rawalii]MDS1272320.1 class I SAM-dependent methyltransferase [Lipingzhangella rawalii]